MSDMRRNSSAGRRTSSGARAVSQQGTKGSRPKATSSRLTQRVGAQFKGKRLSPEERAKKDEQQTKRLNALRIAQVARATANAGWFQMTIDEFAAAQPVEVENGVFQFADGLYRVALVEDETVHLRKIS